MEDEDDVEKHFKHDFDDTGSMTSQDDVGGGGGVTEQSGYHSEEDGSELEGSDEVSVIEDVTASQPPHTNYTQDPPEVFGKVTKCEIGKVLNALAGFFPCLQLCYSIFSK